MSRIVQVHGYDLRHGDVIPDVGTVDFGWYRGDIQTGGFQLDSGESWAFTGDERFDVVED